MHGDDITSTWDDVFPAVLNLNYESASARI